MLKKIGGCGNINFDLAAQLLYMHLHMAVDEPKYLDFTQKPDFQQILTNPILDIAARFWDSNRYEAFKVCYRSMRIVDDLVDERKATGKDFSESEKKQITATLAGWYEAYQAGKPRDEFQRHLIETTQRFRIPKWPWHRLLKAMLYDLDHNGFRNFGVFLRYAEGAAIAPASVFMHLCGVSEQDGSFVPPGFDIRKAARPLALFSYLVHIVRDFQKDHLQGLNYFSSEILAEFGLNLKYVAEIAAGADIPDEFRKLIGRYRNLAEYYRRRARSAIDTVRPELAPAYQLSLEIIYSLYLQIFERIDHSNGRFTAEELNPAPPEVQERIQRTVKSFRPSE